MDNFEEMMQLAGLSYEAPTPFPETVVPAMAYVPYQQAGTLYGTDCAIEKGTLQNLVFDNQAFASHRAMAAVFGTILKLPPLKQAMAGRQFKSVYLDHLLSRQSE